MPIFTPAAPLRLGIVGLGSAARSVLPSLAVHPEVKLVAVADPLDDAREDVAGRFGARGVPDIGSLLALPEVDAVYIATPTELHAEHVVAAARAGKHILCEKPMAIDLEQAQHMIDAADQAGVVLMIGHSHSYDVPYRRIREIIAGGSLGRVRLMHDLYYTDWMYRPRRAEELVTELGGGITYRQGAHQFDVLRLLGGGLVANVRAKTFDWDPTRRGIGAHAVWLEFEDGTFANAIYNGYGAFLSSEICFEAGELGMPQPVATAGKARRAYRERPPGEELGAKRARNAGRDRSRLAPNQPFFGWLIVSCEGGDIRQSPTGLYLYTERGREELELPLDKSTRDVMLEEFRDAIAGTRAPMHDGRWGLANLEVCVAAIASAHTGDAVRLRYQVPVRDQELAPIG
jgi:phthalate 4,5-cis-dihydrodiol dehydrogenase